MPNIARGKTPIEDYWKRSELATDGTISGYTGFEGFAHANWPCTYTLDLENEYPIEIIRFLLWDNKGRPTNQEATREYFYSLSISTDGYGWQTYFTTGSEGFIGWQIFEFKHKPVARYIRLHCYHNTEKPDFHLVEFEVHDSSPTYTIPVDRVKNHQIYFNEANAHFDSKYLEKYFEDLATRSLANKEENLDELQKRFKEGADSIEALQQRLSGKSQELDDAVLKIQLIQRGLSFSDEAKNNKTASYWWLGFAIASFACLMIFLIALFASDVLNYNKIYITISGDGAVNVDPTTLLFEFISLLAIKIVLVSIIIYTTTFCVKNFRTQRHNYTINKHKAMSLSTSLEFLSAQNVTDDTRQSILVQSINAIYSHQSSGYVEGNSEPNPNIFTNVVEKVTSK